jgi:tetratricopeptide (TPR) repeat protein
MSEARTILGARSGLVNALAVGLGTLLVVLVAVYVSFVWLSSSGSRPGQLQGDQQAAEGLLRVQRGEGAQASSLLEQARRRQHGDEVDAALAASYVMQGRSDLAISSLKEALQQKPRHAELWHLLGSLQLQSGDPQAVGSLQQAASLSPRWDVWRDLGEAQISSGEATQSILSLTRAWAHAPAGALRAQIADRIAETLQAAGKRGQAHGWYLRALTDSPRDVAAEQGAAETAKAAKKR